MTDRPYPNIDRVRVNEQGRIVIPAAMRAALGIQPGDTIVLEVADGELRLRTQQKVLRDLQVARPPTPQGKSIVDEFIRERRAEALREATEHAPAKEAAG
jgi:AbrB family looped-hinge helix DNA binding protein